MGWNDEIFMKELIKDNISNFCEKCKTIKNLTVHHKKSRSNYPELEFEITNCQRLCSNCHKEVHQIKSKYKSPTKYKK